MPEGVGYPNTQAVAGTGLDLNYVGDNVYAYSGEITTSSSFQTFLEFKTGKAPILGTLQISADLNALGTSYLEWEIEINGITVMLAKMERNNFDWEVTPVFLPPLTNMKVQIKAQGGTPNTTAMFVGRTV